MSACAEKFERGKEKSRVSRSECQSIGALFDIDNLGNLSHDA